MLPGHNNANLLIQQQLSTYRSDLLSWTNRIKAARQLEIALQLAANKPAPGNLIRSLSSLTSSDRMRAMQEVERHLIAAITTVDGRDAKLPLYMRLTQGHWPLLWRDLDAKRRASIPKAQ